MKTSKFIIAALALGAIIFTSCQKEIEWNNNSDKQHSKAASDNATAENSFSDVFKQASDGLNKANATVSGNKSSYEALSGCATLTITPYDLTTFPKTVTVDFGTTNCMGDDGNNRRGKVIMVTTGWYNDSGTVITVTPDNYYVNDNRVDGIQILTNNGHNAAGHLVYNIETNGTVTTPQGIIHWSCSRQHEWIEGEITHLNPWDDVYLVTGSGEGTTVSNESYTFSVVVPLRVKIGCPWVTSGILQVNSGNYEMTVDYGDGNCDSQATVTINGTVYNI